MHIYIYTLSGNDSKVVSSYAEGFGSIPGRGCTDLYCACSAHAVLPFNV